MPIRSTPSEPEAPARAALRAPLDASTAPAPSPRGELVRLAVGFIALTAVSALLLNVGIYQNESRRETRERWVELERHVDAFAGEIRMMLGRYRNEVRLVALTTRSRGGPAGSPARAAADVELREATKTLGWSDAVRVTSDGSVCARVKSGPVLAPPPAYFLASAMRSPDPVLILVSGRYPGGASYLLGTVRLSTDELLVATVGVDDLLAPIREGWVEFGPGAGAYLTRNEAGGVVLLSAAPEGSGLSRSSRGTAHDPAFRPALVASGGGESRLETVLPNGRKAWSVTRTLTELGCGLVAQVPADRAPGETSGVLAGLVALDVAMALMLAALVVFWRRRFASDLAARELDVTRRHAGQIQAVLDNAFDAILTFDRRGLIRTANPAAEKIFKRPCSEMYDRPLPTLLRCGARDPRGRFVPPEPGRVLRTVALHTGGLETQVEVSFAAAGEGDRLLYTAIVRDISQQVAAEEQVRTFAQGLENSNRRLAEVNAQLEEASRLKSEFLANTSHELRTPLNGMIGFLQLVLDGMCNSPEEEREFLRQALNCSRHLLGLINDVLDIAKIEAGKLALEIESIDVRQLFDEVYALTHVQTAQKGLKLDFHVPETATTQVRGDFRKVKQVLINLVGNSIKFTPSGRITVRAGERGDLGHWMFEVIDTGIGIPPERQRRIFEKFTQADGTTTRNYGGTGLGLAISRSLIELMGGIIGVESSGEGKGTRMFFSLPTGEQIAAEDDAQVSERIDGPTGGPLILLVEDDARFRTFVRAHLHRQGYRTVEARHAEAGWMLARRHRPAAVLLDHALACPDGATLRTGWDLVLRMAADSHTRHIPVVFITGFENEVRELIRQSALARRPEHMAKPVEGPALLQRIHALLGVAGDRVVRVLMADDDPSVVAYVRRSLPEERFHVEVANNGEECLHILSVQPRGFDVLLLDLMMPGVSGYDVLRELAATGRSDLPVLVLTNYPEPRTEEDRRLLEQGLVLDVVAKSVVHDNPMMLPHIVDWHLQVKSEDAADGRSGLTEAA